MLNSILEHLIPRHICLYFGSLWAWLTKKKTDTHSTFGIFIFVLFLSKSGKE